MIAPILVGAPRPRGGLLTNLYRYAVIDAEGVVLATWSSRFEHLLGYPEVRKADRRVRSTPGATGWVGIPEPCRAGDRLVVGEHGGAWRAAGDPARTYSVFFFALERLAFEAQDINVHGLARSADHLRLLDSAGRTEVADELLAPVAAEARRRPRGLYSRFEEDLERLAGEAETVGEQVLARALRSLLAMLVVGWEWRAEDLLIAPANALREQLGFDPYPEDAFYHLGRCR